MPAARPLKRNATLKDVASLAGVSPTLVSYVINNISMTIPQRTRDRVLQAIAELEYVPSAMGQGLRNRKSHIIAQLVLHYKPIMVGDPCMAGKTSAFLDYLLPRGYYHLTYPVPDGEKHTRELLMFLKSHRVDGLVVENSLLGDPMLDLISHAGLPFVVYNQPSAPCEGSAVVNMEDEKGIRLSVGHLIAQGHTRIGFLQGETRAWCDLVRLETFKTVLREHGLPIREEWIRGDGSCTMEDGFRATEEILQGAETPTALAATSDLLALGALRQIRSRGLQVPEDIAIIGFDDLPVSSLLTPPLSSISLSYARNGELAAEQLLALIEEPSLPREAVSVSVRLVERESTGKRHRESARSTNGPA
jgi:LacI family transcriptional regulator